ncbi:allophanate hydrolase-related protein [Colwellia sp. 20A7]|uniref:allophanate hydrolase-related protein n=1 Tax=Colwellia sp. 20A7 TaxID=2689569 RepID=UPI003FA47179
MLCFSLYVREKLTVDYVLSVIFYKIKAQPLGLGKVNLDDGSWVTSFTCEGYASSLLLTSLI